MHKVQRSVLVPYSAAQMFDLVAKVEDYPKFMPWCGGTEVLERDENGMRASVVIQFAGLRQRFTTRNTHHYPNRIQLDLVDGPFSMLEGVWEFQPLADDACKVVFTMQYQFSSRALEALVGPVFNRIATSFIDAFTQRAEACYG
ncbi:type II toxin-antitoxin system RatA family toxin [Pigmentiphaga sp.]|uniref:type II toxin-antitoxin system RatA family toxin n=1 Tax=Pigmentiphaga sp. TaxID=1977564 RepID=UPI00128CD64C|nr:type II toxin-antitoxin system RatA family toxin [Pigmentiphaga sp.]MPS26198.1 type II toxin-antitoxin system RatA family toxin [Alcaligenaceae bacterium SAGV5]MPS53294.1 type II toxin-antitoxin system RatA family toxin [Alcaligenaceae bacterium SAGV3]MPT57772.1 type II toxin-antitoxin system RatA family toxin [Alcaligenaceae bacterium]